jgi:hypothetical protein
VHAWTEQEALRLLEKELDKHDTEPKALDCQGLLRADSVAIRFPVRVLSPLVSEPITAMYDACPTENGQA